MKLFHKVFLCCVVMFGVAFLTAGCCLIDYSFSHAVLRERNSALNQFRYNKYILQSALYNEPALLTKEDRLASVVREFHTNAALYRMDRSCLYSNLLFGDGRTLLAGSEEEISYAILQDGEDYTLFVGGKVEQGGNAVYLVTEVSMNEIVRHEQGMAAYFQRIYFLVVTVSFLIIYFVIKLLLAPVRAVGCAAGRIADGNFGERIAVRGHDEMSELAENFNRMAEKIEEKLGELSEEARKKEEFAANFAHELKTPMTSVIGYADMLYRKELPREQEKEAAEYILNEGLRLSALAGKMMDLAVLGKQEFFTEPVSVPELLAEIVFSVRPICEERGLRLFTKAEDGMVDGDADLLKTLLLNLFDNAVKADATELWFHGWRTVEGYELRLTDNGRGIPEKELSRVTEAFYMVDKSRARSQHGAGLGLALAAKICELHHAKLELLSDGKSGTTVIVRFQDGYFMKKHRKGELE